MSKNIIINNRMDGHMLLMSQVCYPDSYPQIPTQQVSGEAKVVRRRRKKNRVASGGDNEGPRKRKLSAEQVKFLEESFGDEHKLESERKDKLALELGLDPKQVAVWFQNRRARWKNKTLEEEYGRLKCVHENVVVEKCRLESEVLKLKEQLSETEKEIKRLCKRVDGGVVSSNTTSSSSLSMEAIDMPFVGDFGTDAAAGYDEFFYMPDNNYVPGIDWVGLYM